MYRAKALIKHTALWIAVLSVLVLLRFLVWIPAQDQPGTVIAQFSQFLSQIVSLEWGTLPWDESAMPASSFILDPLFRFLLICLVAALVAVLLGIVTRLFSTRGTRVQRSRIGLGIAPILASITPLGWLLIAWFAWFTTWSGGQALLGPAGFTFARESVLPCLVLAVSFLAAYAWHQRVSLADADGNRPHASVRTKSAKRPAPINSTGTGPYRKATLEVLDFFEARWGELFAWAAVIDSVFSREAFWWVLYEALVMGVDFTGERPGGQVLFWAVFAAVFVATLIRWSVALLRETLRQRRVDSEIVTEKDAADALQSEK
ncbi:MAG: hypothetical protein MI920_38145 [Kiloniellales bacterium]|nr:hypothetical protein [Kiloniellales bacterium]